MFLIVVTLQACDPYSHGYVCNQTNDEITLTMKFDYEDNKYNLTKEKFMEWLPDQFDNNLKLVGFDTIKLIGTYRIEGGQYAQVGHGMNSYPPFRFSELTIKTSEGAKTDNMLDKFKKRDDGFKVGFGGNFDLIIK